MLYTLHTHTAINLSADTHTLPPPGHDPFPRSTAGSEMLLQITEVLGEASQGSLLSGVMVAMQTFEREMEMEKYVTLGTIYLLATGWLFHLHG